MLLDKADVDEGLDNAAGDVLWYAIREIRGALWEALRENDEDEEEEEDGEEEEEEDDEEDEEGDAD